MTKVFSALAVSVDRYIIGPHPSPEQPLGTGGPQLFDWYGDGDTPSRVFPSFRLWPASARVFDAVAGRVGATVAGRKTYDDSGGWGGGGPHPGRSAIRAVAPATTRTAGQLTRTDLQQRRDHRRDHRRAGRSGREGVALMGSGVVAAALPAGLLDEVVLHQVPVLLGDGVPFFPDLAGRVPLTLLEVVAPPASPTFTSPWPGEGV